ncbi:hypothetical protein M948_08975 [Virgibacillus sp. CM-4]|uniref:Cell wall-binding protein YocH n=1 Tax=Virgibacillus massiliensis TaxID=1462526 RepID=A0A024Q5G8_9BACI|nr:MULTISPECIES: G5 and 3D domain-containing protein [Virgibacillus]EQB38708.1 hypothetical protein M948_08975 [Virgibacillus sp. CM-4]CDQ37783.1 Cell wall-binding protein YocH precursor [Virgibacillus massiliensis]
MRMISKLMPASTMKLVISSIGVLALVVFSGLVLFDATKAEVVIAEDGKKQTVKTHKNTVEELLAEVGITVGEHDYLSHNKADSVENGMEISYKQAKQVTVTIDDEQKNYYTTVDTINEFLEENNLSFKQRDDVSFKPEDAIEDGLHIKVKQAYQVTINNGGKEKTVWTTGGTVADLLEESQVKFDQDGADKIKPALGEKVTKDTTVSIVRVETEKDEVTETIAFSTEEKNDSSLPKGEKRVLSEGKEGKVEKVYEIVKENGKEVSKELVDENVIEESEDRVVAIGTKQKEDNNLVTLSTKKPKQSEASSESNNAQNANDRSQGGKTYTMSASAYTASCSGCSGFTTTGINLNANPNKKVIAVDPSVIPLGSRVWVEGYGEAIAGDTGGHIVGNRIDVHVPSKQAAYNWGRKTVTVKVIN